MEYINLGNSGLKVSRICLGTMTYGTSEWRPWILDEDESRPFFQRSLELGINFFDTADMYSLGVSEEVTGRALRDFARREDVVIATKVFWPIKEGPNYGGLSRLNILRSLDDSLRRLGTDYVDLHQCHRPDPATPVEETVCAYEDLIRQGKVLYWGVSEWSGEQVVEACHVADARRAYRPISNQLQYSIMRRQLEREVLPTCEREGLGQLAFSPLAQGVLSGKYTGGAAPKGSRASDDSRNRFMKDLLRPENVAKAAEIAPIAGELGLSMSQLALAWCLRQPNVSSVIIGVTKTSQLEENVKALEMKPVTAQEKEWLETIGHHVRALNPSTNLDFIFQAFGPRRNE